MRVAMKRFLSVACLSGLAACGGELLLSPDALEFSATSVVDPAPEYLRVTIPTIETTVTATNRSDRVISLKLGGCPTDVLRVFASSDFSSTPVYATDHTGMECSLVGILPTPLNPGESRQITITAPVSAVLGQSRPAGTYYVEASFDFFSHDMRWGKVRVNAGPVQLSR
jgi:hypothetical protein